MGWVASPPPEPRRSGEGGVSGLDTLASAAGMEARDRPRGDGAVIGRALAALMEAGRLIQPDLPDPCATCAFRLGCMTNTLPATVLTAFRCATGVDDSPFGCHHGMTDGMPTKKCAGWMAAQAADWPEVQAISARMLAELDALPEHDVVRLATDAWLARVDPRGELDDYQRGRLWLRDDPAGLLSTTPAAGATVRSAA